MAKVKQIATCVGCGCTDDKGCDPKTTGTGLSCAWIHVDYRAKVGICSMCVTRANVDMYKIIVMNFLYKYPALATAKEKKKYGIRYPVKRVYNKIKELHNRREFLSAEKRREGRCE
jgi:hypothetical protein